MKILLGDKGHFDFDGPILMSPEQKKDFEKMMRELFTVIQFEQGEHFRVKRLGDKIFTRPWALDELRCLLEIKDINTVCRELGRSWMSVDIKRGEFMPDFMSWAYENGRDIIQGDTRNLIEEYIKDRELEKLERREQRKLEKVSIEKLREKIDHLNRKEKSIYERRRVGLKYPKDEKILSDIIGQIADIEEKIKLKESMEIVDQ
jgi:hypothetical protein